MHGDALIHLIEELFRSSLGLEWKPLKSYTQVRH